MSDHQRDAGAQTAGQGPGSGKRRSGSSEIREDDLEIELGAVTGGRRLCGAKLVFEPNRFHIAQFQPKEACLKAA